jgi:hypothetical protein
VRSLRQSLARDADAYETAADGRQNFADAMTAAGHGDTPAAHDAARDADEYRSRAALARNALNTDN